MGKVYFTSDWHFNHDKDFIWQARGFASVEEMNKTIIKKHNAIVTNEDDVYCLGDCFLSSDIEGSLALLGSLKGKIHIITGNHDTNKKIDLYKELPNVVSVLMGDRFKYHRKTYVLSHYPTLVANGINPSNNVWNLHGHTHSKDIFSIVPNCFHVGVDAHDCAPIELEEILSLIQEKIEREKEK